MKPKYRCLVLDHDDTVVNSTAKVHYPCFVEYAKLRLPHMQISLEDFILYNFEPGVLRFYTEICGMSPEQMEDEKQFWQDYVNRHIPEVFPGIPEILEEQKRRGGLIAVVSHSFSKNILRDYRAWNLPDPDAIYGWEYPQEQRKPHPWPLEQIMKRFDLRPSELLVVDDLKPGYDMAKAAGVPFAAAGWAYSVERITRFMQENCDLYFATPKELAAFLQD